MKVTVLGAAGGIGQALGLLLKTNLPAGSELALFDVNPVVPGVAVDLSHIPTDVKTTGYSSSDATEALKGSDVVIIPAGVPRKPGMTRDDLFNVNAGIVKALMTSGAKACPNACFCIITNPVNSTVAIAREVLKEAGVYNPNKLFGVTTLDVIRSNTFIAEAAGLSVGSLPDVNVIGGHSGNTILPLISQVKGVSFSDEQIAKLTDRIQNAGTEVVEAKAGGGSATLSMGAAALKFALSVIKGLQGGTAFECAYIENPNAPTEFFAAPLTLGKNGIEKIHDIGAMSAYEQKVLDDMIATLEKNIAEGVNFVKG